MKNKKTITIVIVLLVIILIGIGVLYMFFGKKVSKIKNNSKTPESYDSVFPYHEPYGKGIGVKKGRVVWNHNPSSVNWDGTGYWWEKDHFDEQVILKMINDSIASLADKKNVKDGWDANLNILIRVTIKEIMVIKKMKKLLLKQI